ncbi:MAG: MATE family efflux transporter [bacterium]|nr:MATE family efflux transporter [bacterium]
MSSLTESRTEYTSGLFSLLKEAIVGSDRDFTSGPVWQAVVLLSIPMVLELSMESLFAICDVFFVSRLGINAVAAVGMTEALVTLLYAVALGLGMATTAMVARRIGEKDRPAASLAAVQAILLGITASLAIAVAGSIFAPSLLRMMGGSPTLVTEGVGYTRVLFGGSTTIFLLFLINSVFRGAGDAHIAMRALWLANGINLVLDPCLIFGLGPFPELGLTGAAIATTIGRGTAVLYQLWMLSGHRSRVAVDRSTMVVRPRVMLRLARVSLGGIGQFLISTSSWIGLMWIVGRFGSAAVAGYTIAIRIIVVTILPAWGIANSAATLMGQNLGAGKPDRAEKSVWKAGLYNTYFLVAVAITFIFSAELLIGLFTDDETVLGYGIDALRFISYGYAFFAYGMVMVQAFNGAGDTTTPTVINFFCYWLFQIPLAYVLANSTTLEARGVFLAITIAETLIAVIGVLAFRRGRWKTSQI